MLNEGDPAPDFTLPDQDGNPVTLPIPDRRASGGQAAQDPRLSRLLMK
jgi:hypothetical protein